VVASLEADDELILPLKCDFTVTCEYGMRVHPITGVESKHTGIDLGGDHHAEVVSIADGEVTFAGVQSGFGNCVEIKHVVNGEVIYSFYAHLSRIDVSAGDVVKQGDTIGLEGGDPDSDPNPGSSTGHHLHFEIRSASGYGNDVDPNLYFDFM
jgi:murein DD-endopeptidase MepM/ murein hydrolase activator NlpD